jgi:hypothetical protein
MYPRIQIRIHTKIRKVEELATWLVWRSLAAAVASSSPLTPRTWVSFMATCGNSAELFSLSSKKF